MGGPGWIVAEGYDKVPFAYCDGNESVLGIAPQQSRRLSPCDAA